MNHVKNYHKKVITTNQGSIVVEGPISSNELKKYNFHEQLTAFRPAKQQFEAIVSIADLPEGRILIARNEDTIIGYVTYLHPDPLERWSTFKMENLIVLGAIEVIPAYRGAGVASTLLKVSMMDEHMENYITISTEYYWHWDLNGTKLSIWEYRKVMEKMMAAGGLHPASTDDPEIISHPANCLMVRIGKNVDEASVKRFDTLRFLQRHHYRKMRRDYH